MAEKKSSSKGSKNTPARRNAPPGGRGAAPAGAGGGEDLGSYITLGGQHLSLAKHPTDFSLIGRSAVVASALREGARPLASHMTRLSAVTADRRDDLMRSAREDSVAHHIYQVAETGEEIVIDDRIILNLDQEDPRELGAIREEYSLVDEGRLGDGHVLRITEATGMNPLKAANSLAARPSVVACCPQVMVELQLHAQPELFPKQWYLTGDLISHPDLLPDAGIDAPEAWQLTTGDPQIVVAVIDDGFDLGHPALAGVRIHPDARDFQGSDNDPGSEDQIVSGFNEGDYHGTPVASIAVGSHGAGSAMRGIAPGCTFLPVRIGFGPMSAPIDILDVFKYVSARADVVNCSFGIPPRSFDAFGANFRTEITRLTETGGRRGKGLVMVFSAGNDDAPTFLRGNENVNGVKYTSGGTIAEIPPGRTVFSGYPLTPGVVVAAAMSSLKRKSGYSSWGPHITVTAPSNNMHYITSFIRPGADPRRNLFLASYRGLGQVAATNRPGHGAPFSPLSDNPTTGVQENFYTERFGGTSGAAPVITGVVGLMLSANPTLSAAEVRQILQATADQNLDPTLDLANDPNTQGLSGAFVSGRSPWFGAGKVNAHRAVSRARALPGGIVPGGGSSGDGGGGVTPAAGPIVGEVQPNLSIPDNRPAGVVSTIDINADGALTGITVTVDISHTWRGDLRVVLISPDGFLAELHRFQGGSADDLRRSFTAADTDDLARLVQQGVSVRGRWSLNVSDHVRRDVGKLNSWRLELQV